jgi:hypothetical protein
MVSLEMPGDVVNGILVDLLREAQLKHLSGLVRGVHSM